MKWKDRWLITAIALAIADVVIPVPILGIVLIHAILAKPAWFRNAVREIYGEG